jgi:hypothetical protein
MMSMGGPLKPLDVKVDRIGFSYEDEKKAKENISKNKK